ncbi:hypothetical protein GGTG_05608 [Gaeumannomyces tritici R3-111a-1]|uniref:Uncharacterized protein n=1 Tax=Gaeumannomyces tritici (strain R3-111a-1) TaxID=644352 RepID=J3NWE4_GAET3|nr:hypothetical protein GGTG_05608 [Gaeumannomyces tritici R3-111a-1]EJT75676.1 hypothetical protein GGTG_05608 [Gaeumannomyces tritici R3-111a-1]
MVRRAGAPVVAHGLEDDTGELDGARDEQKKDCATRYGTGTAQGIRLFTMGMGGTNALIGPTEAVPE